MSSSFDFDDEIVVKKRDFTKQTTQSESADKLDEEVVIKRLYSMTKSSIDQVDKFCDLDGKGMSDVVRAAVWLLDNASEAERNEAYRNTKIVKKQRGRKSKN
ncbi:TPA: hypothetical protein ACX6Q1_003802 [Photobacterium damselae]